MRQVLEGHFGNPIVSLSVRLERRAEVRAAWRKIRHAVDETTLREPRDHLDDDLVFHVRFDKQRAFAGALVPTRDQDVVSVRARVAAFPKSRESAVRTIRESLEDQNAPDA